MKAVIAGSRLPIRWLWLQCIDTGTNTSLGVVLAQGSGFVSACESAIRALGKPELSGRIVVRLMGDGDDDVPDEFRNRLLNDADLERLEQFYFYGVTEQQGGHGA